MRDFFIKLIYSNTFKPEGNIVATLFSKKDSNRKNLLRWFLPAMALLFMNACVEPGPEDEKPFSIIVYKTDSADDAVAEAKHYAQKGYPCEVFRTTEFDYVTAVGGFATQEEADSILKAIPDTIVAENANPYVRKNSGFLGKIFSSQPPPLEGAVRLGDFCIPVYTTNDSVDAMVYANKLFENRYFTEVYVTGRREYTVTIGAYLTEQEADFAVKESINDGVAPRGISFSSRKAYGKRIYPL
jgi:hypothetical protein